MAKLTVVPDRRIDALGEPEQVLPEWGMTVRAEHTVFHLHPPIDFELSYRVDRYVAFLPFSAAVTDIAIGDGPLARRRLRAGSIYLVEPQTCVRARQVEPVEFLVLSIDPAHVRALTGQGGQSAPGRLQTVQDLVEPGAAAIAREVRRSMLGDALPVPAYLQALADSLIVRLVCHFVGDLDEERRRGEALSTGRLARLLRHIDDHLDGTLRVQTLAGMAGLTRSHFSRAFQRMTGDPPHRFILKRRICRARDLLADPTLQVAEVAARAGFSSQSHMTTAFRDHLGVTPARYRDGVTAAKAARDELI